MTYNTSRMSERSRAVVNHTVHEWLEDNSGAIDKVCLLSEVFTGKRKRKEIVRLRRELLRHVTKRLRVKNRHAKELEVRDIDDHAVWTDDPWHKISFPFAAAILGVDHTAVLIMRREELKLENKECSY